MFSQTLIFQKQILPHVSPQCEEHCHMYAVWCVHCLYWSEPGKQELILNTKRRSSQSRRSSQDEYFRQFLQ